MHPANKSLGIHRSVLLTGPRGSGKQTAVRTTARQSNLHVIDINCHELIGDTAARTESYLREVLTRANAVGPCIALLRHVHVLETSVPHTDPAAAIVVARLGSILAELSLPRTDSHWPVLIVATTDTPMAELSQSIVSQFTHTINVSTIRRCQS